MDADTARKLLMAVDPLQEKLSIKGDSSENTGIPMPRPGERPSRLAHSKVSDATVSVNRKDYITRYPLEKPLFAVVDHAKRKARSSIGSTTSAASQPTMYVEQPWNTQSQALTISPRFHQPVTTSRYQNGPYPQQQMLPWSWNPPPGTWYPSGQFPVMSFNPRPSTTERIFDKLIDVWDNISNPGLNCKCWGGTLHVNQHRWCEHCLYLGH